MHKPKKKKKCEKGSSFVVCSTTHKAGNAFRGLKCHFSGKSGWFSSDSNLFRGQIWGKIPQNPCLGVDFCITTKVCLGYISKPLFMHVNACIFESPSPETTLPWTIYWPSALVCSLSCRALDNCIRVNEICNIIYETCRTGINREIGKNYDR